LKTWNSIATRVISNLRSKLYRAGARGFQVFIFFLPS